MPLAHISARGIWRNRLGLRWRRRRRMCGAGADLARGLQSGCLCRLQVDMACLARDIADELLGVIVEDLRDLGMTLDRIRREIALLDHRGGNRLSVELALLRNTV